MRNKIITALFLGICLFSSACETMSEEDLQAKFQAKCQEYGFKAGTEAFANCLMETEQNYYAALSDYMNKQTAAIQSQVRKPVVYPAQTRCSTAGGHTNCTTY